jgi:hypothetical protein
MDRQTLLRYLAQTDDHIDQAIERLERQSATIERLRRAGRDTRAAEDLLSQFECTLRGARAERRTITGLLEALSGGAAESAKPLPRQQPTLVG